MNRERNVRGNKKNRKNRLTGQTEHAADRLSHRRENKRPWHVVSILLHGHQAVTLSISFSSGKNLCFERETGPDAEQETVYRVLVFDGAECGHMNTGMLPCVKYTKFK